MTVQLILGVIVAAVIVVGSAVVPAVVADCLDVWSQATVVMLTLALIAEVVGGYFAFHGTLTDQCGPLDQSGRSRLGGGRARGSGSRGSAIAITPAGDY